MDRHRCRHISIWNGGETVLANWIPDFRKSLMQVRIPHWNEPEKQLISSKFLFSILISCLNYIKLQSPMKRSWRLFIERRNKNAIDWLNKCSRLCYLNNLHMCLHFSIRFIAFALGMPTHRHTICQWDWQHHSASTRCSCGTCFGHWSFVAAFHICVARSVWQGISSAAASICRHFAIILTASLNRSTLNFAQIPIH